MQKTLKRFENFHASRGGSGALYPQSAIVGVMSVLRLGIFYGCPGEKALKDRVLCNRNLRTVSDPEGSSTKQSFLCATRSLGPSRRTGESVGKPVKERMHGSCENYAAFRRLFVYIKNNLSYTMYVRRFCIPDRRELKIW